MFARLATYNVLTGSEFRGDAEHLRAPENTDSENLIEFGARVCYRSVAKMGHSDVISSCMREGHKDVAEHGYAVLYIVPHDVGFWTSQKYLDVVERDTAFFVGGNLRAWRDVLDSLKWTQPLNAAKLEVQLGEVSPNIFSDVAGVSPIVHPEYDISGFTYQPDTTKLQFTDRVQLIGLSKDIFTEEKIAPKLGHATFYFHGVSRALTHQLVRHRILSFSQSSQRYIDAEKGEWGFVIPPSIQADEKAKAMWHLASLTWDTAYRYLRDECKIRKEDARYVLPAATESDIVVSGTFFAWKDFFRQRLAKDAQWEIREVAQEAHAQLKQVAPHVF